MAGKVTLPEGRPGRGLAQVSFLLPSARVLALLSLQRGEGPTQGVRGGQERLVSKKKPLVRKLKHPLSLCLLSSPGPCFSARR